MLGFGQREGLEISATYTLNVAQANGFMESAGLNGWKPMPIPQAVRVKIRFQGMKIPLDLGDGLYTCRTAGDNVLYAKQTLACSDVETLHNIILGVFDPAEAKMVLVVRSGY